MFIIREFKLMGGRTDFQYVSSVEKRPDGKLFIGYDKKQCYALDLGYNLRRQVVAYLNAIECKLSQVETL